MSLQNRLHQGYNRAEVERQTLRESQDFFVERRAMTFDIKYKPVESTKQPPVSDWENFWYDFFDMDSEMDRRV